MFCRKCGAQIEDGALYCVSCGAQLQQSQPAAASEPLGESYKAPKKPGKGMLISGAVIALAVVAGVALFNLAGVIQPNTNSVADYDSVNNEVHAYSTIAKDGDWVYYVPTPVGYRETASGSIWRVHSNGGDPQAVYTPEVSKDCTVGISGLYVAEGRLYFRQNRFYPDNGDNTFTLESVALDGSDLREEMKFSSGVNSSQVIGNTLYFSNNRAVFSQVLNSDERSRVAQLESEGDDWVIADGYVYVSSYSGNYFSITRTSLEDKIEETVYTSYDTSGEYVTPFQGRLYFSKLVDPNDADYLKEIVSLDPVTGDLDVLFKQSRSDQYITNWAVCDKGVLIVVAEDEKPTEIILASLDGSNEEPIYTYDGDWAGNPLTSRNIGGKDEAFFEKFSVLDGGLYFWPQGYGTWDELVADDSSTPVQVSLCKLSLDEGAECAVVPICTIGDVGYQEEMKPA